MSKLIEKWFCFLFEPQCPLCGSKVSSFDLCGPCSGFPENHSLREAEWIHSSFELNETARLLLHSIKYHQNPQRIRLLLPFLPRSLPWDLGTETTLIPVPLSRHRFFERGFNQAEWLARELSQNLKLKLETRGLLKTKETRAQSTLSLHERKSNLAGAFLWNSKISLPRKVCLVDDVFTTGNTLEACRRALQRAGVRELFGWTLFKAVPDVIKCSLNIQTPCPTPVGEFSIHRDRRHLEAFRDLGNR